MGVTVILGGEVAEKGDKSNDPKSVEDCLKKIGSFSWFQVFAGILLIFPELPSAMITTSPLLTGTTTFNHEDYTCEDPDNAIDRNITKLNFCEWKLFCQSAWIVPTITSLQMAGNTIGALILPRMADKVGRRKIFFGTSFVLGLSGSLAGLAPNVEIFALLRFISGLCMGGLYLVCLTYLMEFLLSSCRTIAGCVTFWAVGEMILALAGYLFPEWRKLSVGTAFPMLIVPLFYAFLPESPRWLLSHNRTSEAAAVFNRIAKWNGRPELPFSQIQSVQNIILCNQNSNFIESNKTKDGEKQARWHILSILKPNPYRRQFVFLICIWFTSELIYFGVSFNTSNLDGNPYLNILFLGITELPGPFSSLLVNNRFGRKRSLVGFLTISAILFALLFYLKVEPSRTTEILSGIGLSYQSSIKFLDLVGRYCIAAAFGILACATAESFPTAQRLTYSGICGFFGKLGGILAPQIVFLATVCPVAPYIAFFLLSILATLLCFGLMETSSQPLSD